MDFDFGNLVCKPIPWLQESGEEDEIVISCRIRLARNISNVPFPNRASSQNLTEVVERVQETTERLDQLGDAIFLPIEELSSLESRILVERRLISPEFVQQKIPRAVAFSSDEKISIMINEEDHLRLQGFGVGLSLSTVWDELRAVDDGFAECLDYAFSDQFGYLTACPTNTGTGMRVSAFVHLPATEMCGEIEKALTKKTPSGLAVRGFYGEGTDVIGSIYQISNQLTLGWTEWRIIEDLIKVAKEIVDKEDKSRQKLMNDERIRVEDRVFRSIGILSKARLLTSKEFIEHYSYLLLGVNLGIISQIQKSTLNELMIITQPAHIQRLYGSSMRALERDVYRAELVRDKLKL